MKYKKGLKCMFLFIKTLKRKDFPLIFFYLMLVGRNTTCSSSHT